MPASTSRHPHKGAPWRRWALGVLEYLLFLPLGYIVFAEVSWALHLTYGHAVTFVTPILLCTAMLIVIRRFSNYRTVLRVKAFSKRYLTKAHLRHYGSLAFEAIAFFPIAGLLLQGTLWTLELDVPSVVVVPLILLITMLLVWLRKRVPRRRFKKGLVLGSVASLTAAPPVQAPLEAFLLTLDALWPVYLLLIAIAMLRYPSLRRMILRFVTGEDISIERTDWG